MTRPARIDDAINHEGVSAPSNEIDELHAQVHEMASLIAALQIVCWEFCQTEIEDKGLRETRAAILGLTNALERLMTWKGW